MALRNRNGIWHFRFELDGREYAATTGLAATKQNMMEAQQAEFDYKKALMEGRKPSRRIVVREFQDAAEEFLPWAKLQYPDHPNSFKRIKTSFASLKEFFGREAVSLIDEARLEAFKTWRRTEHKVRDITIRHDLHACSTFFGYAVKQRWARENPVRNVDIPSDANAIRIHVVTAEEEKAYFSRAAKNKNLHDLGRLIWNQGMRPEEVLAIPKSCADLDRGQLHITFGKTPAALRTIDLTAESRQILARRMTGNSPWIFPSKRKRGGHIQRMNGAHDRLCEKALEAGVVLRFVLYDFRHTFATKAAETGMPLPNLAAILGHNSLRAVQKYVHPTAENNRAAMRRFEAKMRAEQRKEQRKQAAQPN
jgi:site-specific recombinase XerD